MTLCCRLCFLKSHQRLASTKIKLNFILTGFLLNILSSRLGIVGSSSDQALCTWSGSRNGICRLLHLILGEFLSGWSLFPGNISSFLLFLFKQAAGLVAEALERCCILLKIKRKNETSVRFCFSMRKQPNENTRWRLKSRGRDSSVGIGD